MTDRTYSTIIADPPWRTSAGRTLGAYTVEDGEQVFSVSDNSARDLPYQSMTVDAIASMRVKDVASKDAHLYLWTTNGYLRDAFDIAKAWGFKHSTTLVWAKTPFGGGLGGAYGISTEFCLFCRRGSLAAKNRIKTTWFNWPRPYDQRGKPDHSRKPEAFRDMVEQVSPGPYLELFARDNRLGWDAWGNECLSVDLPLEAA